MDCQRFLTILIAMLALAALRPAPGMAADANGTHAANQVSTALQKHASAQKARAAREKARKDKPDRREPVRRISTYTLFRDPQFKLDGAVGDRRRLDILSRNGTAPNLSGVPSVASARSGLVIPQRAFRASQPDGAGLDFNCHEKILNPAVANRETSACYQYELGKAWKAQTYVSRQRSEGNWGGGMALGLAY